MKKFGYWKDGGTSGWRNASNIERKRGRSRERQREDFFFFFFFFWGGVDMNDGQRNR